MGVRPAGLASSEESLLSIAPGGTSFRVLTDNRHRQFWSRVAAGGWEPQTYAAVNRFLVPDSICIDIGAWIGPITLYAASRASKVHAIEPDPVAFGELEVNVAANPDLRNRISLHPLCISPARGPITLYAGGMYAGETSQFGDSMSGLVASPGVAQPQRQVEGLPLEDFMAEHASTGCSLIKMDVEGGEYCLIPGRWRHLAEFGLPTLLLSFHAPPSQQRRELLGACLEELKTCYSCITSVIDRRLLNVDQEMAEVQDWSDEETGSAWRKLDYRLGVGVLASNEVW